MQHPAIPLEKIENDILHQAGVQLSVLRLDLTHPQISGNKWYKLKYNLQEARHLNAETLVTMGGAYSNHIIAVAAAGKEYGFKTIGIIRGEELHDSANSVLRFAKECGMKFLFATREEYRQLRSTRETQRMIRNFVNSQSEMYLLPEGGTNELAVKGCREITSLIPIPFDVICCPVGTAGTLAGIALSLKPGQHAIGFSVLNAPGYHESEVKNWITHFQINPFPNFQIENSYHFGGYANTSPELLAFISDFESRHKIPLEPVYSGKMMFGLMDRIRSGKFLKNSSIIAIHTGGVGG